MCPVRVREPAGATPGPTPPDHDAPFLVRGREAARTLVGMDVVHEVLQIGVCVLISIAVVLPLLYVWRDDHTWLDRPGV